LVAVTRTVLAFAVVFLAAGSVLAASRAPSIEVELGEEQIYEGQSVAYRVTLNNIENPSPPELKGFDDFEVTPRGETSLNSSQIIFSFNGQPIEIRRSGRQYNYLLTPRKTGLLRIPGPTVTVDGKVLKGRELTLRVRAAAEQDVVILELAADRRAVQPLRPFTVTVSVLVKEIPSSPDIDPLTVQRGSLPVLSIPWIPDERLPKGITPATGWHDWLRSMISSEGSGVSINRLAEQRFSLLFDSPTLGFHPTPKRVTRRDGKGAPAEYWRYDFPRKLAATGLGRYSFGPVTLEGRFATGINDNGRLIGERIYAVSKRIEIAVEDAPEQGRPENYIRAFGRFQVRAELAPRKARTGDPMTLSLTLTGEGTFQDAVFPDLSRIPEIGGRFKVYEATQEVKEGSCRLTYSLRPLREGKEDFPPIALSFYDPQAERYESVRTEPIPIEITRAERLSGEEIVSGGGGAGPPRMGIEARREGIFANITDPAAVRNEAVSALGWFAGFAGAAGAYVVALLMIIGVRRLTGDRAAMRRRSAPARARARLRHALAELHAGKTRQGADSLQDALVGLVADWADLPEASLTPKDVCRQLAAFGTDEPLLADLARLLEACDAARYGAFAQDGRSLAGDAEELLGRLIASLKNQRLR